MLLFQFIFLVAHHAGGILFLCELHELRKAKIQNIVTSHDQQIIRQVQLFDCQLNIFDCAESRFIGAGTIINHRDRIRSYLLLIVLPILKVMRELMV